MNPTMTPTAPPKERTLIPVKEKIFEVNPFVAEWLKALRSGKYTQTKKFLKTDKGYCCLGVAAEAVIGVEWEFNAAGGAYHYSDGVFDFGISLQDIDAALFNLDFLINEAELCNMGVNKKYLSDLGEPTRMNLLIRLNDIHDRDFEFIANIIETQGWHLKLAS